MPLKLVRRTKDGPWYIRGTVRKRRIFETTDTVDRAIAEALRAKRETEVFAESILGKRVAVSFGRAALSYLEFEERSERTTRDVGRLIELFGEGAPLIGFDQSAADRLSTRRLRSILSAVLNHAAARGWCARPSLTLPKLPKGKTRWLTPAEALALLDAARPHLRPLLHFILCTGARLSEALYLDWADVDLAAAKAIFRDTKNGTDRAAALPEAAIVTLANLPGRAGAVFRTDDGSPYADTGKQYGGQIKTGFRGACMRAQIRDLTPHDLRHTFSTWFYALTKDPLLLKAEGGWKSLQLIERYAHLMPSALVPEIAKVWGNSHPRIGALPVAPAKDDARARA